MAHSDYSQEGREGKFKKNPKNIHKNPNMFDFGLT